MVIPVMFLYANADCPIDTIGIPLVVAVITTDATSGPEYPVTVRVSIFVSKLNCAQPTHGATHTSARNKTSLLNMPVKPRAFILSSESINHMAPLCLASQGRCLHSQNPFSLYQCLQT